MPFDGSGNYNRTMNWTADAAAGIKILASRHDTEDNAFSAGLSQCITKDGQTSITADISWNGKKITNLANPVNPQDAATKASVDAKFLTNGLNNIVFKIITSTQTYTKPAGLRFLAVDAVGAGGGGAGTVATAAGTVGGGSGGSAGARGLHLYDASTLPASFSITIGAAGQGGTGGANGTTGGATIVNSTLSAGGGTGGATGSVASGSFLNLAIGAAGAASGFTMNIGGETAANTVLNIVGAQSGGIHYKSGGGSTAYGNGPTGVFAGTSAGSSAPGYGSGGGGSVNGVSQPAKNGGDAGPGLVILTEYY